LVSKSFGDPLGVVDPLSMTGLVTLHPGEARADDTPGER
jgi:hypothetical protein